MIFWVGVIAAVYLFYKWGISTYDYFEKRGVKFLKPVFLMGSNTNMFFNKLSLPDLVTKWYNMPETRDEK